MLKMIMRIALLWYSIDANLGLYRLIHQLKEAIQMNNCYASTNIEWKHTNKLFAAHI